MCKELKKTSRKAQNLIDNYNRATRDEAYSLWDVYGTCSERKKEAFKRCREKAYASGNLASCPVISSFNANVFTFSYLTLDEGNKDTGTLHVITPANDYAIRVSIENGRFAR